MYHASQAYAVTLVEQEGFYRLVAGIHILLLIYHQEDQIAQLKEPVLAFPSKSHDMTFKLVPAGISVLLVGFDAIVL